MTAHDIQRLADEHPRLTPIVAPWMRGLLADRSGLAAQFARHGSPLNILAREPFVENYRRYRELLDRHELRHLVFFARKANKCRDFVVAASEQGLGVDTASYRELEEALALGCDPARLVVTAAMKDARLVELAISRQVLIVVDNLDECRLVERVAQAQGRIAEVGIRISGFRFGCERLYSRFGFALEEAVTLVAEQLGPGTHLPSLRYRGLQFHLNGYSRRQRAAALLQSIACADALASKGVATRFIDIGGGFLVNYLREPSEWETFLRALRAAAMGNRSPLTFQNDALGLVVIDGAIHGEPSVYPYFNERPKERFLDDVLSSQDDQGNSLAALLRSREIELRMEPGRSLLDQAGLTIARIGFRKRDSRGDLLVGLEMNRSQLFSSSADFLLDPIMIHHGSPECNTADDTESMRTNAPVAGYLVGGYCLEQDLILKRKIAFNQVPQIGDWVCFPNTAGYMMHFFECESHLFELAANIMVTPSIASKGAFRYQVDE